MYSWISITEWITKQNQNTLTSQQSITVYKTWKYSPKWVWKGRRRKMKILLQCPLEYICHKEHQRADMQIVFFFLFFSNSTGLMTEYRLIPRSKPQQPERQRRKRMSKRESNRYLLIVKVSTSLATSPSPGVPLSTSSAMVVWPLSLTSFLSSSVLILGRTPLSLSHPPRANPHKFTWEEMEMQSEGLWWECEAVSYIFFVEGLLQRFETQQQIFN